MNLKIPKKPIFNTILANNALISELTSTCISGNHTCNGQIGYLIANIKNKKIQIKIFKYKLSKKQMSEKKFKFNVLKCKIIIRQIEIQSTELSELKIIK